jgi:hypothetical protein
MRLFLFFLFAFSFGATAKPISAGESVRGCLGTYGRPAWLPDGHADTAKLLHELEDIHADTFHWAIHGHTNEFDEIKTFLPLARKKNIKVWITLMPPSESPPKSSAFSEPFRLDYETWAKEIAQLSLKETNLVAWSIDDFTHNLKIFTPEYLGKMMTTAHRINPKLAFVPCCYYREITPTFAKNYTKLLDAVLFPYRDESSGGNLKNPDNVEKEIAHIRQLLGPQMPIILDIYASPHSRLGATTPEYVEKSVSDGLKSADGVLIYTHQDPVKNAEKYQIIKRLFTAKALKR